MKESIVNYYGKRLVSIVLYGSLVRGTATPESDIDMLLIVEKLHKRKMKRIEEFTLLLHKVLLELIGYCGKRRFPLFR